jgi:multimeric flavodoxin WrbA
MPIRILGVCGSPIAGGNTEVLLDRALDLAGSMDNVQTELVSLAGKDIADCQHCNWCLRKQEEGRFCALGDDMGAIYPKVLDADALLLATPVYIGRLSGYLAVFMDRLRAFIHGNLYRGRLTDKVGGAMAVGWFRHAGLETALQSICVGFMTYQMVPVGSMGCPWGAPAVATQGGTGRFDKEHRHGVLHDEYGLLASDTMVKRMVSLARKLAATGV